MKLQFRLNTNITKIIDGKEKECAYVIREEKLENNQYKITVKVKNSAAGCIKFSLEKHYLYIKRMDNYTVESELPLKHVGSVLFEYAFKTSLAAGLRGHIELQAIEKAPAAYYKMGLRKKSDEGTYLEKEVYEYLSHPNEALKEKIQKSSDFISLEKIAKQNKGKDNVTFEEIIKLGSLSPQNAKFGQFLSTTSQCKAIDCYNYGMQGMMYLTEEMIAKKTHEFLTFIPIGYSSMRRLPKISEIQNPRLKELVNSKQLDPINTCEISNKLGDNDDPILEYLLSPIGLEMMQKNYISGWFMTTYYNIDKAKHILSKAGLEAFEEGKIENIYQALNYPGDIEELIPLGNTEYSCSLVFID